MKTKSKIIFSIFLILLLSIPAAPASAQLVCPNFPICNFAAILGFYKPVCTNGALVRIFTPLPVTLLVPYVPLPIWPIVPVFKLFGPIPTATTEGNFVMGGYCKYFDAGIEVRRPVFGTILQIGTTAGPTSYIPKQF